jgi:4-diphosphocytidyl-2-C-methyl-D-erythritol kinase
MRLRALAPAKVNLCLFLGGLRDDDRHRVVTLLESISLHDTVQMTTQVALGDEVICPGVPEPNLVTRTLAELREWGWEAPRVQVKIEKRIPVAAGVGGGSADAAATLRLADRLAPLGEGVIGALAAELGADVPSQLEPGLSVGTGAGNEVLALPARAQHALLIVPNAEQLATADVYAEADRLKLPRSGDDLEARHSELINALDSALGLPSELLVNDLEPAAISLCPSIGTALEAVRAAGANHALVCGSGPTVAGIYWGLDGELRASAAAERLRTRFPGTCAALPVEPEFGFPLFA